MLFKALNVKQRENNMDSKTNTSYNTHDKSYIHKSHNFHVAYIYFLFHAIFRIKQGKSEGI